MFHQLSNGILISTATKGKISENLDLSDNTGTNKRESRRYRPKDVEPMSLNLEVHRDIAVFSASRQERRILGQNTHDIPGLCI